MLLSKSMEKSFLRLARNSYRHAFIEAEATTAIAHQIRVVRQQRGLTQAQLAKALGTTQAAVSRLEDPSYGRLSVKTLVDLAKVFDVGLSVRFVSLIQQFKSTRVIEKKDLEVPSFSDEQEHVVFCDSPSSYWTAKVVDRPAVFLALPMSRVESRSDPLFFTRTQAIGKPAECVEKIYG